MNRIILAVAALCMSTAGVAVDTDAYIESSGVAGIDTGYRVKPNTRIAVDFALTTVEGQENGRLFGADYNTSVLKMALGFYVGGDNNSPCFVFGYGDTATGWHGGFVKDANGNVIEKVTTTEYNDADYYLCGDPTPELYGGFGTSFSYKGFDFAASFTYSIGGLAYDSGYATYMTSPSAGKEGANFHKDMLKAWTPENKDTDVPAFYYNELYASSTSDRFLTDASYLNFQNAQIGYSLPARISQKARVSRIRVYAACDNIVYWSKRRGLDPRQSHDGSTSNVMNSPVRTTSVGFNITF